MQRISHISLIMFLSFCLFSCASIHEGNYAEPEGIKGSSSHASSLGIVISGSENSSLSSTFIGELDLTFENRGSDWVRIKNVTIDFGSKLANDSVKIPVGEDLIAWAKAAEQNKAIADYNTSLVLGSVATIGVVGLSSRNTGLQAFGASSSLLAIGGISLNDLQNDKQRVEVAKLVPTSHLMSESFVIPPGLHTKKWIALYTKTSAPYIRVATISYTLENGTVEKAKLDFRSFDSNWQPAAR